MAERMGGDSKYGRLFTVDDVCAVVFAVLVHHGIEPTLAKVDTEGAMRMMDEAPEGDPVRPTFPADEPLFLLRGQDAAATGRDLDRPALGH